MLSADTRFFTYSKLDINVICVYNCKVNQISRKEYEKENK